MAQANWTRARSAVSSIPREVTNEESRERPLLDAANRTFRSVADLFAPLAEREKRQQEQREAKLAKQRQEALERVEASQREAKLERAESQRIVWMQAEEERERRISGIKMREATEEAERKANRHLANAAMEQERTRRISEGPTSPISCEAVELVRRQSRKAAVRSLAPTECPLAMNSRSFPHF